MNTLSPVAEVAHRVSHTAAQRRTWQTNAIFNELEDHLARWRRLVLLDAGTGNTRAMNAHARYADLALTHALDQLADLGAH